MEMVDKDLFVEECSHKLSLVGILQMDLQCNQMDNCILDCDFAFDKLLELHMYQGKGQRIFDSHMLVSINIHCLKHILVCMLVVIRYSRKHMNRLQHHCSDDIASWNHKVMDCKDLFQQELRMERFRFEI